MRAARCGGSAWWSTSAPSRRRLCWWRWTGRWWEDRRSVCPPVPLAPPGEAPWLHSSPPREWWVGSTRAARPIVFHRLPSDTSRFFLVVMENLRSCSSQEFVIAYLKITVAITYESPKVPLIIPFGKKCNLNLKENVKNRSWINHFSVAKFDGFFIWPNL